MRNEYLVSPTIARVNNWNISIGQVERKMPDFDLCARSCTLPKRIESNDKSEFFEWRVSVEFFETAEYSVFKSFQTLKNLQRPLFNDFAIKIYNNARSVIALDYRLYYVVVNNVELLEDLTSNANTQRVKVDFIFKNFEVKHQDGVEITDPNEIKQTLKDYNIDIKVTPGSKGKGTVKKQIKKPVKKR